MRETRKQRHASRFAELEQSLRDCREAAETPERFSRAARARILHEAADRGFEPTPLSALFLPIRKLALAGVFPVLLLSAMLGYLIRPSEVAPEPLSGTLTVGKQGNAVIFSIANGDRTHRVLRSAEPKFAAATAFTTSDGRFIDRLDGGPDLIFYRID